MPYLLDIFKSHNMVNLYIYSLHTGNKLYIKVIQVSYLLTLINYIKWDFLLLLGLFLVIYICVY